MLNASEVDVSKGFQTEFLKVSVLMSVAELVLTVKFQGV